MDRRRARRRASLRPARNAGTTRCRSCTASSRRRPRVRPCRGPPRSRRSTSSSGRRTCPWLAASRSEPRVEKKTRRSTPSPLGSPDCPTSVAEDPWRSPMQKTQHARLDDPRGGSKLVGQLQQRHVRTRPRPLLQALLGVALLPPSVLPRTQKAFFPFSSPVALSAWYFHSFDDATTKLIDATHSKRQTRTRGAAEDKRWQPYRRPLRDL